jgi:hypothetical protein
LTHDERQKAKTSKHIKKLLNFIKISLKIRFISKYIHHMKEKSVSGVEKEKNI